MYRIVFDVVAKKPGCVLLQAAFGGTVPNSLFYKLFPCETWQLESSNCAVYEADEAMLELLSKIVRQEKP